MTSLARDSCRRPIPYPQHSHDIKPNPRDSRNVWTQTHGNPAVTMGFPSNPSPCRPLLNHSMPWHYWLDDRKGIWLVRNPTSTIPEGSPWEAFQEPGYTWNSIWKNRLIKWKTESYCGWPVLVFPFVAPGPRVMLTLLICAEMFLFLS